MRGVAYALTASVALVCGALTLGIRPVATASATAIRTIDTARRRLSSVRLSRAGLRSGSYDGGPRDHTAYYERGRRISGELLRVSGRIAAATTMMAYRRRLRQMGIAATATATAAATTSGRTALLRSDYVATTVRLRRLWVRLWRLRLPWLRRYGTATAMAIRRLAVSAAADRRSRPAATAAYGYGAYTATATDCGRLRRLAAAARAYIPYGWSWYRGTSC